MSRAAPSFSGSRWARTRPTWSGNRGNRDCGSSSSASHTNSVYALSSAADGELRVIERISVALTPRQPPGMTPSGLALDAAGKFLFIACSDANAVAVADVSGASARVGGFLPTGWYPTAVLPLPQGGLVVLNGKGVRSFPNPKGPRDTAGKLSQAERDAVQQVGRIQIGGMSLVDPFDGPQLAAYTRAVYENSPYRDFLLEDAGAPADNPVPSGPGRPSPIHHVIYIVKENRTYDQVLRRPRNRQRRSIAGSVYGGVLSQPPQARPRVRSLRQLLCQWRRQRRRAQLVGGRHRAGLHRQALAQHVWRPGRSHEPLLGPSSP